MMICIYQGFHLYAASFCYSLLLFVADKFFRHNDIRVLRHRKIFHTTPFYGHTWTLLDRLGIEEERYKSWEEHQDIPHSNNQQSSFKYSPSFIMQFKLAFVSIALATLAVATPAPRGEPASSCSTGPVQCCNTVESASTPGAAAILGLLGIVLQDLNVLVGLTCSPITVIGLGNSGCSAQAVCCNDNSNGGLISIGCVPVTL
ncbi:fungal hydrophobin-domain-containing protein [Lentinula edodes]|nr:fungal hydrophobin-domain-containing protein [Lentinula edodes]